MAGVLIRRFGRASAAVVRPGFPFLSASSSSSAEAAPAPAEEMVELTVNGKTVSVPKGASALQACDLAGVDVPRFCYHHRLSIAGNCRMCLVDVEKAPKAVASCAFPVMPGMVIKTDTDR